MNIYFDLSGLGLLKISGAGAAKLLQGQLSCDIDALQIGSGIMGAQCNPQGRVISLFYIFKVAEDFYLAMPEALLSTALNALKKYAPFYKASLEDVTEQFFLLGALDNTTAFDALATYQFSDSGRMIYLLQTAPAKALSSYQDWLALNFQEGIPSLYPETSGLFLPHDLNLPQLNAVSFTKGCFTGQEIIARMHYRGKPKNHLYRGQSEMMLAPGTEIYADHAVVGTIIDCSQEAYQNTYPLLFVANAHVVATETLQTKQGHLIELQKSE